MKIVLDWGTCFFMKTDVQVNITVPNAPSSLAKVCDALRSANVNILAIACTEGAPSTIIHLIVNDFETAKIVLKPLGKVSTTEVVSFVVQNKPGAIASIGRAFAGAGINIKNIYSSAIGREGKVYVIVEDCKKAMEALKPWKNAIMEAG